MESKIYTPKSGAMQQEPRKKVPMYLIAIVITLSVVAILLGIKLYIETALLPREMMRQRNSTVIMKIGDPISRETFTPEKSHAEWAEVVKKIIYSIK